jgi:hypothetical protein
MRVRYGPWLLHFCTSVVWRVLQIRLDSIDQEADLEPLAVEEIRAAENAWRKYLLGEIPNPGRYRLHLVPLDRVDRPLQGMPPNFNRYLTRAIQIDLCHANQTLFVLAKLGRFLILGFISQPEPNHWAGSRVNANEGTVQPTTYNFPHMFMKYLFEQSRKTHEAIQSVSDRQREKIDRSMLQNIDRIAGSDFFDALNADVEMFGHDAFAKRPG